MKYFSEKGNEEYIYPLSEYRDRIKDGEKEIILLEMKRDIGGEMFCVKLFDFVNDCPNFANDCGSHCSSYSPCNGISGRCRYLGNGFIGTGRKFKLTTEKLEVIT